MLGQARPPGRHHLVAGLEQRPLAAREAALNDPGVVAVTCPFSGIAADLTNLYDRLGALYTNGWTLPSAIVASLAGHPCGPGFRAYRWLRRQRRRC